MKKIAIIAPALLPIPPVRGGAVENLVNLWIEENERDKRIRLSIVTPYDAEAYEMSKQFSNTRFLWFNSKRSFAKIRNRFYRHIVCPLKGIDFYDDDQSQIISLLKNDSYDKIIMESRSEFINTLGRIFGKEKIVCHIHIRPEMVNGMYNNCSSVFSVSEYIKQEIVENTKTPAEKIKVLKNAIDTQIFKPNKEYRYKTRKTYSIDDDVVAICYVGRLVELKGIDHLIKAIIQIDKTLKFKLFIIGSLSGHFGDKNTIATPFVNEIQKLVDLAKDKIEFTGYIDNAKLPQILNGMDIAVMPSKYKEAAPLNNVEYQAIGLPVVTTDMGGIPEYITNDSAIIVKNNDQLTESLKQNLIKLIMNENIRKKMGAKGIENAQQYSKERYFENLINLIHQ